MISWSDGGLAGCFGNFLCARPSSDFDGDSATSPCLLEDHLDDFCGGCPSSSRVRHCAAGAGGCGGSGGRLAACATAAPAADAVVSSVLFWGQRKAAGNLSLLTAGGGGGTEGGADVGPTGRDCAAEVGPTGRDCAADVGPTGRECSNSAGGGAEGGVGLNTGLTTAGRGAGEGGGGGGLAGAAGAGVCCCQSDLFQLFLEPPQLEFESPLLHQLLPAQPLLPPLPPQPCSLCCAEVVDIAQTGCPGLRRPR